MGSCRFACRLQPALHGEMLEAVEIAAHAKPAIAQIFVVVAEDRQSRKLDGKAAAAVDRPIQRDAAPGLAGRDRLAQPVRGIEPEGLRDLVPWSAEARGRAR